MPNRIARNSQLSRPSPRASNASAGPDYGQQSPHQGTAHEISPGITAFPDRLFVFDSERRVLRSLGIRRSPRCSRKSRRRGVVAATITSLVRAGTACGVDSVIASSVCTAMTFVLLKTQESAENPRGFSFLYVRDRRANPGPIGGNLTTVPRRHSESQASRRSGGIAGRASVLASRRIGDTMLLSRGLADDCRFSRPGPAGDGGLRIGRGRGPANRRPPGE